MVALRLSALLVQVALVGCSDSDLRGEATPSADGLTYLAIANDSGGACRPIYVDGKLWPHPVNAASQISPGKHIISCGGDISFTVKKGTVFHFDYWGP
jgi:hypothetical protein